ncbi:glutamate racemase [Alteribacillus iranensis]|uniref:Glutamate racemase n=1 Tax=Alteribacillus iranensis TaxID=930128 RepID=A0A1I2CMM7_9BACI|nr:glutamate racemase [Alteribacillus iranensis]SFE69395.1 glutamate racemase [Alteribacillus iranensis]
MNRPIGIIDSGVGGLTVVKEIQRQLPKEELVYIGDTARCPYGPRPVEEVRRFTWQMIDRLIHQNIKMLVIACNTATAVVLEEVRETLSIPVVGVIRPGAAAALKATENEHVAIIGTEGTIKSKAYLHELYKINENITAHSLACPSFVPLVERGEYEGFESYQMVKRTLEPLMNKRFDTLILGCTHYPLLADVIQKAIGSERFLISSGTETAREVSTLLYHNDMLFTGNRTPCHTFYTTGSPNSFTMIANRWLDTHIDHPLTIHLGENASFFSS